MAVGFYQNGNGDTMTLAERWDGIGWTLQSTPTSTAVGSRLDAVSCPTSTTCIAVGSDRGGALAEIWSGGSWTIQPTEFSVGLGAVSCASPTDCMAVGTSIGGVTDVPFAARLEGSTWSAQPLPSLNGDGDFFTVSCSAPDACTAGGSINDLSGSPSGTQPLVERWDGSHWTLQTTPWLANGGEITGISCPSASACTAVASPDLPGAASLAEGWDGNNWTTEYVPEPSNGNNLLGSVSCASATACTAVGSFTAASDQSIGPAVEAWDGSIWTIQPVPSGPGPTVGLVESTLGGISCPSPGLCVAVGSTKSLVGTTPLVEIYS
jgi:hypothetical protein